MQLPPHDPELDGQIDSYITYLFPYLICITQHYISLLVIYK